MKIAITGATGFVGHKLAKTLPEAICLPSLKGKTASEIEAMMRDLDADLLIHTAAISDIGACAADPESSYYANVTLPVLLAKFIGKMKLICFSSDQVYSGSNEIGPYTEDMVAPGNLYAEEKLEMEHRVLDICPSAVMLRAEWMYDYVSSKGNYFVNLLNAQEKVCFSSRQYRGVTYVQEVADAMPAVAMLPGGAYNFGSETDMSIYDITAEFISYLGLPIHVEDKPQQHNLWMNCQKARACGVDFSSVLDGLKKCTQDYKRNIV